MNIITSGYRYLDIDAYAGIIAYAELLQKQGLDAHAVSTASLNESITPTLRSWPVNLLTTYQATLKDTFTLIDISEPDFFDSFVNLTDIDRILDHHPGYEQYWQDKIGGKSTIEPVGAACTLVFEEWVKQGLLYQISTTSARLLMCGILDNTLNFGAQITTSRDEFAYRQLARYADLPMDWAAQYFNECQETIDKNPVAAIEGDIKLVVYPARTDTLRVGQVTVWHAQNIIDNYQADLEDTFQQHPEKWFINLISVGEKRSYFMCTDKDVQRWLSSLLGVQFNGSIAIAERLWLRKEIFQQAIDQNPSAS